MELKKEDFILVTVLNGQKVLALRPDYFAEEEPKGLVGTLAAAVGETMEKVFMSKEAAEIEIPEPELTAEELAEIEKQKNIKKLEEELAKAKGE